MKRGFEAVLGDAANLSAKPWPDFLKSVGTMLVMKVGGASGPLYGTLFMGLGKDLPAEPTRADQTHHFQTLVVKAAEDYALSHPDQRVYVTDLCRVAGVSERARGSRPVRSIARHAESGMPAHALDQASTLSSGSTRIAGVV